MNVGVVLSFESRPVKVRQNRLINRDPRINKQRKKTEQLANPTLTEYSTKQVALRHNNLQTNCVKKFSSLPTTWTVELSPTSPVFGDRLATTCATLLYLCSDLSNRGNFENIPFRYWQRKSMTELPVSSGSDC